MVDNLWAIIIIVVVSLLNDSIAFCMYCSDSLSSALVASSRIRMAGSFKKSLARALLKY
jgi:hypothetical protein